MGRIFVWCSVMDCGKLPTPMNRPFPSRVWGTFTFFEFVLMALISRGNLGRAADPPLSLGIRMAPRPVLQWQSRPDASYRVEFSSSLPATNWQTLAPDFPGTGGIQSVTNESASKSKEFYRLLQLTNQAAISPNAMAPIPGLLYPGNTLLGVAALGLQYRIPAAWKGGVRADSSTLLFGSDTEPGLVLGVLTLAGDGNFIMRVLPASFWTDSFGGFSISQAPSAKGSLITGEWTGFGSQQGALMRLTGVVHPSGGLIGFIGFFTPPNRSVMQATLDSFVNSTVTVPRLTDQNWVDALRGRAFRWSSYKSTGNGGNSGSLSRWSENNAFFCTGTYEITTRSESTYGGTLSGGAFYGGGSSSNSTEVGDWTVVRTPSGSVLVLLSSTGVQAASITLGTSGNSFYFGDQEFSLTGAHACTGE